MINLIQTKLHFVEVYLKISNIISYIYNSNNCQIENKSCKFQPNHKETLCAPFVNR